MNITAKEFLALISALGAGIALAVATQNMAYGIALFLTLQCLKDIHNGNK